MEINRHNYEEYFLLYVDNELSTAERKDVELFLESNPDLKEELDALQQSLFLPEEKISFPGIESLLKKESDGLVNAANYEEYFVLYGDDELNNRDKEAVEVFVYKHPEHQAAFEVIQAARLQPDTAEVFHNKEILYKKEKSEKVFYINWLQWSVAAAIILLMGVLWLNKGQFVTPTNGTKEIAGNPKHAKDDTEKKAIATQPGNDSINGSTAIEAKVKEAGANGVTGGNNTAGVALHQTNAKQASAAKAMDKANAGQQSVPQGNDPATTNEIAPVVASNELPLKRSTVDPIVNGPAQNVVKTDAGIKQPVVDKVITEDELTAKPEDGKVYFANTDSNRKNVLRGFLRKASRVIERNANVDTDERSGILIGNFAIAR